MPPASAPLWSDVERIVESGLNDAEGLCAHALAPLAAAVLAHRGCELPAPILRQHRAAQLAALTAPVLLARARDALQCPMLLMKGPEAAARYPDGARTYGDLDILVPDTRAARQEMLGAGFVEEEDVEGLWVGLHHLAPLFWPGLPLKIELHHEPKWLDGVEPPSVELLFEAAVPSRAGVEGVLAPAPAHHALLLAAHAWAHHPLGRARDLVDIGAFTAEADAADVVRLAHVWGLSRVWATTSRALDAFLAGRRTWPLRLWAKHIHELRIQTVFEDHLERLISPFWGFPPAEAARRSAGALVNEVRPAFDEDWPEKIKRSISALRGGTAPVTEHRQRLGESATRGRGRNKPPEDLHPPPT